MSERNLPSGEQRFANHPMSVVHNFLNHSPMPSDSSVSIAMEVLARPGRDALGKCLDLPIAVSNPTLVLAEMFGNNNPVLPIHWREEPELARTVLCMSVSIETGILRATQLHLASQGETSPDIEEEIESLTKFAEDLQVK